MRKVKYISKHNKELKSGDILMAFETDNATYARTYSVTIAYVFDAPFADDCRLIYPENGSVPKQYPNNPLVVSINEPNLIERYNFYNNNYKLCEIVMSSSFNKLITYIKTIIRNAQFLVDRETIKPKQAIHLLNRYKKVLTDLSKIALTSEDVIAVNDSLSMCFHTSSFIHNEYGYKCDKLK